MVVDYVRAWAPGAAHVNSAPADLVLAGNSVQENENDAAVVGTVSAADPDAGDTLTYSLLNDAAGRFVIDATTGVITVANGLLLDYEAAISHQITVKVADAANASYEENFTINVLNRPTQTYNGTNTANIFSAPSSEDWLINGNGGDDALTSGRGKDVVRGGAGNDTINTGANDDIITYSGDRDGFDIVNGGSGNDVIRALANNTVIGLQSLANVETITANNFTGVSISGSGLGENLDFWSVTLTGITRIDAGAGNDVIKGSSAADVISGGGGFDTLTGNGGSDKFAFTDESESRPGGPSDIITDFITDIGGDKIDLHAFDASNAKGQQPFSFITGPFTRQAGQLHVEAGGDGYFHVLGDTNGNGTADFEIRVVASSQLTAAHFVL